MAAALLRTGRLCSVKVKWTQSRNSSWTPYASTPQKAGRTGCRRCFVENFQEAISHFCTKTHQSTSSEDPASESCLPASFNLHQPDCDRMTRPWKDSAGFDWVHPILGARVTFVGFRRNPRVVWRGACPPATHEPQFPDLGTRPLRRRPKRPSPPVPVPRHPSQPEWAPRPPPQPEWAPRRPSPTVPAPRRPSPPVPAPRLQSPPVPAPRLQSPPVPAPRLLSPPVPAPRLLSPPVPAPRLQSPPVPAPRLQSPPVPAPRLQSPPVPAPRLQSPPVPAPRLQSPPVPAPSPAPRRLSPPVPSPAPSPQPLIVPPPSHPLVLSSPPLGAVWDPALEGGVGSGVGLPRQSSAASTTTTPPPLQNPAVPATTPPPLQSPAALARRPPRP
ncbi:uncharacterized protein si:ch211-140m22.7 isoform X1 [Pungitius pungitius]|uniref:uncharacterized protein si:ch211-140m22.7 isoform X1 n=1 Tax=Pungitius pungitius TaxID=134920 RepID=UPI002E12A870